MARKNRFLYYASITTRSNAVVSRTPINTEALRRVRTYDNVNGNNNNGCFGMKYIKKFKMDSLQSVKFRIANWSNFSKNINCNNNVQYVSNVVVFNPKIGVDYIYKDVFDFKPRYRISFTNNKYNISAFEDRNFTSHNLGLNTVFFLQKVLNFETI